MGYGPLPEHVCSVCDETFLEAEADVDRNVDGAPVCAECVNRAYEAAVAAYENREPA